MVVSCDYQDYLPQIDSYDRIKDEESRFVARPVVSKMAGSAEAPTRHALHIVHSHSQRPLCAVGRELLCVDVTVDMVARGLVGRTRDQGTCHLLAGSVRSGLTHNR